MRRKSSAASGAAQDKQLWIDSAVTVDEGSGRMAIFGERWWYGTALGMALPPAQFGCALRVLLLVAATEGRFDWRR